MEPNKPLVSVIMPFYNGHAHVVESVKSVLAQDYQNYELLIVNDGSKKPSLEELLKDLNLSKVRFINHEKNKGLSATRNTAFAESKGEFILPLDCDDMIAPSFLSETVQILMDNPDISAVYTKVKIFGDVNLEWTPEATMLNLMCGLPIPSTVLFRRNIFDLVDGYNTQIKCVPDVDFWIRVLAKDQKLYRLEKPLYHYRKHQNSLSDEGKLTEVYVLAEANKELYMQNFMEVISLQEEKYFKLKKEYAILEDGFRQMQTGYEDLLQRYNDTVKQLQKRSIRYHLKKIAPFL